MLKPNYRLKPRADGSYDMGRKLFEVRLFGRRYGCYYHIAVVKNSAKALAYLKDKGANLSRETIYL